MSTVVYQELQTCYETRRISLKLNAPKLDSFQTVELSQNPNSSVEKTSPTDGYSYSNMFGWNGIEALSNTPQKELSGVYIHPLVKRSSSALSQRSLEMCTESLGCETGTCIMESSIFFPPTKPNVVDKQRSKSMNNRTKEVKKAEFPPPLTTISGSDAIHVQQFREEGRLVIKAVASPPPDSCLRAERSDGRLRLSFAWDNYSSDVADIDDYCYSDDEQNNNCTSNSYDCEKGEQSKENVEKKEIEGNECELGLEENVELNEIKVELGVRMGFGKMHRTSRCKERGQGNNRLINWEPFWVAT